MANILEILKWWFLKKVCTDEHFSSILLLKEILSGNARIGRIFIHPIPATAILIGERKQKSKILKFSSSVHETKTLESTSEKPPTNYMKIMKNT